MNIFGLNRIEREKATLALMIRHFCQREHRTSTLCQACTQLLAYAHSRTDKCRFGSDKPVCARCAIHCYKSDEKEAIRQIMRKVGPRMILLHPYWAFAHLWDRWRKR